MSGGTHTPLPWVIGPFGEIWPESDVEFVDGKWREKCPEPRIIASASKGNLLPNEDVANATFIVRAVNCHDDMLSALDSVLTWYGGDPDDLSEWSDCMLAARAARLRAVSP